MPLPSQKKSSKTRLSRGPDEAALTEEQESESVDSELIQVNTVNETESSGSTDEPLLFDESPSVANRSQSFGDQLDSLEAEIKRKKDHKVRVHNDWNRVEEIVKADREVGKKAVTLFFAQYDQHPLGNPVQSSMKKTARRLGLKLKSKPKRKQAKTIRTQVSQRQPVAMQQRLIPSPTLTVTEKSRPQREVRNVNDRNVKALKDSPTPDSVIGCPEGSVIVSTKRIYLSRKIRNTHKLGDKEAKRLKKHIAQGTLFCMDRYEYMRGDRPLTRVTHSAARNLCSSRGMRLCTENEWQKVCTQGGKYHYARYYKRGYCNVDEKNSVGASISPKAKTRCTKKGVYHLIGNVSEWTQSGKVLGGHFETEGREASCGLTQSRSPNSQSELVGFRCCSALK